MGYVNIQIATGSLSAEQSCMQQTYSGLPLSLSMMCEGRDYVALVEQV